jgi:hypothetical protein
VIMLIVNGERREVDVPYVVILWLAVLVFHWQDTPGRACEWTLILEEDCDERISHANQ